MVKLIGCARLVLGVVLAALTQTAGAAGGPDVYGYTFLTSADAGGPAADWIDISASGTLVTGLADDNSAPTAIALPKPFLYYETHQGSLKIGSNGWVAFNNVSNIASCFPTIPTAGGPDGYLAPYMSDLNFTGAGNPGLVRTYYDAVTNQFIVSYINVPYWTVSAPGWAGSNTFQVVLSFVDNTIRFNYLALTAVPQNAACNDITVGIESLAGNAGLEYVDDANVPAPFSIVFSSGKYEIGGTVNGLAGSGLTLQLNGASDLPIAADGSFAFPQLLTGGPYSVTVSAAPNSPFQVCSVTNGSGTISSANVSNVQVSCVTGPESTTTSILSDIPSSGYGDAVTFTATVTGAFAKPTGPVAFYDTNNALLDCANPALLDASDPPKATCTTSTLDAGAHSIRAAYSGDADNLASQDTLTQQVAQAATTTTIGSACMLTFIGGQEFTIDASVTGTAPTGTATFLSGVATVLCSTPLTGGSASCTTSALNAPAGGGDNTYYLSATYSGDTNYASSASPTLTVNVLDPAGVVFRNDFENVPATCPVE